MVRKLTLDMDQSEQKVLRDVEEHGLHVTYVREEGALAGWAFSIGLYANYRHPEIVLFGLRSEVMHRVINNLANDIKSGKMYDSGFEHTDVLEGIKCLFHWVDKGCYPPFFGFASWFYERDDFPVLQCIWPDKQQNYPWSSKFRSDFRRAQPWLFRRGVAEARVEAFLRSMYDSNIVDEIIRVTDLRTVADSASSACTSHEYDSETWPFDHPKRLITFATPDIADNRIPIVGVFHEQDGSWMFIGSEDLGHDQNPREVCMGCLYKNDSSLSDIADLTRGWGAWRRNPNEPWRRRLIPADDAS